MHRTLCLFLLLFFCFCGSQVSRSASAAPDAIRITGADCSGWPVISLEAGFPAGEPEDGTLTLTLPGLETPLTPVGVKIQDAGKTAKNLLVAIDTSRSLLDDYLEAIQVALRDHIRHLGGGEQLAVLAFNDTVQLVLGFTDSRADIGKALGSLRQGGAGTELYEALLSGARLLKQLPGDKSLLVISDGHNEGKGELKDVIQTAKDAGVRIFAIALPEKHPDRKRHLDVMRTLAGETGGAFQAVENPLSAASGIFTLLQAQRQTQAKDRRYRITFSVPAGYAVTQRPIPAVLSRKTAGGVLAVDVPLSIPDGVGTEKDGMRKALDFVRTPAGMACAAAVLLLLLLLCFLAFRKKGAAPEARSGVSPDRAAGRGQAQSSFVLELTGKYASFPLPAGRTRIGASGDNEIVLDDPTVSRRHACLEVIGQECRITDTRSTNGTYVNGHRISRPCILKAGDQIYFGKTQAYLRTVKQGDHHG